MLSFLRSVKTPLWLLWIAVGCALAAGILLRFYHLKASGFFFYDEGLYLQYNRGVLEFVQAHQFKSLHDKIMALGVYLRSALASGKSFWFFIIDMRFLWGGLSDWTFSKVAAALCGIAVFPLVFLFARRYYGSRSVACLAVAILAVLPSHVFYSRVGLQEAFSTVLVLGGFYLYLFPGRFGPRTILAGLVLASAFFANYRLVILPFMILVAELWAWRVERQGFNLRKYVWFVLTFAAAVVLVGSAFGGAALYVIFAWIFHQGYEAPQTFAWINFLSYPYYLCRMENVLFAGFFFAGVYAAFRRQGKFLLPFFLVCVQMLIFSTTGEKGARYICVVLPFAVMSAAFLIKTLYDRGADVRWRVALIALVALMLCLLTVKSAQIARASSDYTRTADYLAAQGTDGKFMATQEQVLGLYFDSGTVKGVQLDFSRMLALYAKGYRYLVIDPQGYVGSTQGPKFTAALKDYLSFIDGNITPVKTFPHMNQAMLERFVFEHSENLATSVRFLDSGGLARKGSIRIYDLAPEVPSMAVFALRYRGGQR